MAARTNARVNRRESFFERDPLTYRLVASTPTLSGVFLRSPPYFCLSPLRSLACRAGTFVILFRVSP